MNFSLIKNTEKLVTKPAITSLIHSIFPLLDSSASQDGKAFPKGSALKPYHQAKHVGWTHYWVMIPELPAPTSSILFNYVSYRHTRCIGI